MIHTASTDDEDAVIATLLLAFATDPVVRWCYRETGRYTRHFPEFVRAFAGRAFEHGSADVADGCVGAALWLPPHVQPDGEELSALMQRSADPRVQPDLFSMMEQMEAFHPEMPCWYLPLVGVDQSCQGRGHGSALLAHALARCDRDGVPAYLESTNPDNLPLYKRHGFEVMGEIQVGSSPAMVPMIRQPLPRVS